jgi:hypothetical protein
MFETLVRDIFNYFVAILKFISDSQGEFGFVYNLVNLIIFMILQSGLIILFLFYGE